jgi:hypothetical protein
MRSLVFAATAMIACFVLPAQALDLGGKGRGGSDKSKGKSDIGVSIDRNGIRVGLGKTKAQTAFGNPGDISPDATAVGRGDGNSSGGRSTPVDAIHERLDALSGRDLVELCAQFETPAYCSDGDKSETEIRHVIGLGLNKRSEGDLRALCNDLSGKGCGNDRPPVQGVSAPVPGVGIKESDVTGQFDSDERAALGRRCAGILKRPGQYDSELLDLCVLMQRI